MSINKEEDVEAAMSNIDLGSKKASPGLANTLTQLNWIEKMKAARLERKSTNKSSSSSEYSPEAPQPTGQTPQLKPKVKTYRRSSFSALIHHTPILAKRSEKKKHMVLRKALSASQTTMDQLLLPSMARVYMRVSYDTVTHVVSVLLIQSNKLQHSERQKLYPRIQFGVFICNGEMQSTVYKTQVQSNLDLIDIKETFYFPNVDQSTISDHSVVLHVTGKDRLFFGTERLLSQGSLLLDKFSVGEQLYCSVLMEENVNETDPAAERKKSLVGELNGDISSSNGANGKLLIGLKYDTLLGNLTVKVVNATSLYDHSSQDKSPSTFVRLTLFNEERESTDDEFQTSLVKSNANPTFNQVFEFSIPSYEIENYSLFISVFSKKLIAKTSLIGQIVFDNQPKHNQFVEHLSEAVSSDGDWIMKCHALI